jgi:membrane dipeptidase
MANSAANTDTRMQELLRRAPLIDLHNDLLWEMRQAREQDGIDHDVTERNDRFQTDMSRLQEGAVGGQFWSVYVPSDLPGHEGVTQTLEQIDAFYRLLHNHPDRLEHARTADDVERIAAAGRVASMIGVEGGHSIGGGLGVLRMLARLGIGYLTLTHNDDTEWADSATGQHPHKGLTTFGEDVVRELNDLGILVDCSHTSEETARHAIEVSRAPVILSHSNARALCDVPRNVTDEVLELVGRTGGVACATFVPDFLTREGAKANAEAWEEWKRLTAEHGDDREAAHAGMDEWFESRPPPPASLADVADHIDHIRDAAGIDAVGIGSDFDGVQHTPEGLEDVSCYPELFQELADRGYTDEDLAKVAGRNLLRVMRDVERLAAGQ